MSLQAPQAQHASNRLAVVNAKGGTGKTTVGINLSGALNQRGHDVLFVDMDPQGVATEGLDLADAYDAEPPTMFDYLIGRQPPADAQNAVAEHDEMDVLPASVDYLNLERELTIANMMAQIAARDDILVKPEALEPLATAVTVDMVLHDRTQGHTKDRLDMLLSAVEDDYDYVVIDAPPFYGELFDNVLYAAPNIVVPALAESTSQRAVELLFDQIAVLEDETGIRVSNVLAVANRVDALTNEAELMVDWLDMVFDVPLLEIPERVALQYAYKQRETIFTYEPESDVADLFLEGAAVIENHFATQPAEVEP